MPAINITINIVRGLRTQDGDYDDDDRVIQHQVSPELKLLDLKEYILAETGASTASQLFYLNGQILCNNTQTLHDAGIMDHDMLAVHINNSISRSEMPSLSVVEIERRRQRLLNDDSARNELRRQAPHMVDVLNDPIRFRDSWVATERPQRQHAQRELDEMQSVHDNINEENQARILEHIREEHIEKQIQEVLQNYPELFGRVTMLYINVEVNGHPVKAFVDSGAQATIMSPACAEACNVSHLIDKRFAGIARGVGTAKIIGRVHQADVKIGDAELPCAFTVMEGKDVDMLLGLDMLKRYQACLDLQNNRLILQSSVSVPFLPESEIPKSFNESFENEPTIPGPGGLAIGAKSGSLKPAASLPDAAGPSNNFGGQGRTLGPSATTASAPTQRPPEPDQQPLQLEQLPPRSSAPTPGRAAPSFPQPSIDQLVAIGYSREQAIEALRATGGNVEYAAGFLFENY